MAIRRTDNIVEIDSTDSPYTVPTDGTPIDVLLCDTTGGEVEVVLPAAIGGEKIKIVREAGAVNAVTIFRLLVQILSLPTLGEKADMRGKADGTWARV